MIQVMDPIQNEHHRKLTVVRDYLQRNNVPLHQRQAVKRHMLHAFEEEGIAEEAEVLALMPKSAQPEEFMRSIHQVEFEMMSDCFGEHFEETDPILHDLVVALRHEKLSGGALIYTKGEVGTSMMIVLEGSVEVYRCVSRSSVMRAHQM